MLVIIDFEVALAKMIWEREDASAVGCIDGRREALRQPVDKLS